MQRFDRLIEYEMTPADFEGHDTFEDALEAYEQRTGRVCVHIHVSAVENPYRVFCYFEPEEGSLWDVVNLLYVGGLEGACLINMETLEKHLVVGHYAEDEIYYCRKGVLKLYARWTC